MTHLLGGVRNKHQHWGGESTKQTTTFGGGDREDTKQSVNKSRAFPLYMEI